MREAASYATAAIGWVVLSAIVTAGAARQAAARSIPLGVETFDAVWTMIRDTHFDPAFNGVDWEAAKRELRPKVEAAATMEEVREVIRALLAKLGQSHFTLIPSERAASVAPRAKSGDATGEPGMDVRLQGGEAMVVHVEPDGPAAKAGVKTGWLLRRIAGQNVSYLLATLPGDLPAAQRDLYGWAAIVNKLRGAADLEFETADATRATQLTLAPPSGEPVTMGNLPTFYARFHQERLSHQGATVGLIRFNVWMTPMAVAFARAMDDLRGGDGLVIDLRGNTGGLAAMIMGVSGHLLSKPVSLGTMKLRDNELQFTANPRTVGVNGQKVAPFAGPVALLVDELTYSASEIFTGGLQAIGRARVFGRTTGGGTLPSSFDRLPNGDVLLHAIADFISPKGERLEGRGVVPDVVVPRTRADLLAGRDAVLEAAIEWIAGTRR